MTDNKENNAGQLSQIKGSKLTVVLLVGLALVTAIAYSPGMSGGFILDDFPNLALLSLLPENGSLIQVINLSTNGIASDLGRPLSMFSFLLQAGSWPEDPFSFKVVNLGIHIINGGLLLLLFKQLGRAAPAFKLGPLALASLAALWLLHPIHISSVLYVVQRMNLLSSMAVLSGLLTYLWSRHRYMESGKNVHLIVMVCAPVVFAIIGVLCKENGVLLYLYLLALEVTLLNQVVNPKRMLRARALAVFIPLALGALGFLFYLPDALSGYAQKPFSIGERTLTQFPVLVTYLRNILFPLPQGFGLFHDSFPIYSSPFAAPVWASALLILLSLSAAVRFRSQYPVFAFCVFWFLFGHALESTVLPLEMYFEHRNYLPSIGILFGIVVLLKQVGKSFTDNRRRVAQAGSAGMVSLLCIVTSIESSVWGDSLEQAYVELERRPTSYRAQTHLVQSLSNSGNSDAAYEMHQRLINTGAASIGDYIRWLEFGCILGEIQLPTDDVLTSIASDSVMDYSVIGQLNRLLPATLNGACPAQLLSKIVVVLDSLLTNEQFEVAWPDLLYARASVHYFEGERSAAADSAASSFSRRPDISVGLTYLDWLVELERLDDAREFLTSFESRFRIEIQTRGGLTDRLAQIRSQLEGE